MASNSLIPLQTNHGNKTASLEQIINPTECPTTHSAERGKPPFGEASSNDVQPSDRPASPVWDRQDGTLLRSNHASQLDGSSTILAIPESKTQSCSIDGPSQAMSTNTAVDTNISREHHGIYWEQAGYMFTLALSGAALAIGHHVYYSKLDGVLVASAGHQQWAIRFGTAFSFLVKSCLQASTILACGQCVWKVLRNKSLTMGGVDNIFALTSTPFSFLQWELYKEARPVLLVALLTWLLPAAAIVPPATLSVTLAGFNETIYYEPVPTIDWLSQMWQSNDSLFGDPSSLVLKTASETAQLGEILPLFTPATNSSYEIQFSGPTLQCGAPNESQRLAFETYTNRSMYERAIFSLNEVNGSYWTDYINNISAGAGINWPALWAYSTFSPNLFRGNPDLNGKYSTWDVDLGYALTELMDPGTQQLWVQLLGSNFVCQLVNSSFAILVDHFQGSQRVIQSEVKWLNNFNEGSSKRAEGGAYIAIFTALASILNGNVSFSTGGELVDHNSQILQTNLLACPELDLTALGLRINQSEFKIGRIANFPAYNLAENWQCPNGSLERAIEGLANNVTIAMLSSTYLTQNTSTQANASKSQLIYAYESQNLLLSYSIALLLTSVAISFGVRALQHHGVTHGLSFSVIVATTRNPTLDKLFRDHQLGSLPLPEDILKTKLNFGMLVPSRKLEKSRSEQSHISFGLQEEIVRFADCYRLPATEAVQGSEDNLLASALQNKP